jgi:hypothetical protein
METLYWLCWIFIMRINFPMFDHVVHVVHKIENEWEQKIYWVSESCHNIESSIPKRIVVIFRFLWKLERFRAEYEGCNHQEDLKAVSHNVDIWMWQTNHAFYDSKTCHDCNVHE